MTQADRQSPESIVRRDQFGRLPTGKAKWGPIRNSSRIAVVTVNWNGWRLSLSCLEALRQSRGVEWHLYLVDNASTDGSQVKLSNLGDDVTVLLSEVNGGWTGGNNLAIRQALNDGFETIFILNNDARVEPDTMHELQRYALQSSGNPLLAPIHFDESGQVLDFIGAVINTATGLPEISEAISVTLDTLPPAYPTAFIKGAGIFASRVHFDRLGLFDEKFYLNYDDTDWCFRARASGFELLMLSTAHINHGGSGSIGGAYSALNIYFLARNQLLFAERHCSWSQRPRQIIEFMRQANRLSEKNTVLTRALVLLFGRSTLVVAWRAGVRDYLLRRFGDCPTAIRRLGVVK